jgi:alpha-glucosidase
VTARAAARGARHPGAAARPLAAAAIAAAAVGAFAPAAAAAQRYTVRSPDGATEVAVAVAESVTYAVARRGRALVVPSPVALTLADGRVLGRGARVRSARPRPHDAVIRPAVPVKSAEVRDRYGELRLDFAGGYALEVRAYDDGAAYRWVADLGDSVTVAAERATFRFAAPHHAVAGLDTSMMTHYEPAYARVRVDSVRGGRLGLLPFLVDVGGGAKVAVTESGLEDYPGMYLVSDTAAGAGGGMAGVFPAAALEERRQTDRDIVVTRRAPYLARTSGRRAFPWRALVVADEDRLLLENQLVYKLAPAQRVADASWVRPGLVSWDWWHALNLRGVPFRTGLTTETYRYYVDFAARQRIPYVILDEGWSPTEDLTRSVPAIDVPGLVRYAAGKGVGVVLWALWKPLDRDMERVFDRWKAWGVKGAKVDFVQRDDQAAVNFYWRAAREAAARGLVLDFHGAHKPAGLNRAYPNVLTFEGVRGLEFNKWSDAVTPEHDVTVPFTRMLAGPLDFTPGALYNAQPKLFRPVFDRPWSQGTRAHQLAMYVVYESPLQMLADAPTEYEREPDVLALLGGVPTVWDETRALAGRVGDYAVLARRRGRDWYVGAMTDTSARALPLDLSFLGPGAYRMESWADGPNADRDGRDYRRDARRVTRADRAEMRLAPGGGFVARLRPVAP